MGRGPGSKRQIFTCVPSLRWVTKKVPWNISHYRNKPRNIWCSPSEKSNQSHSHGWRCFESWKDRRTASKSGCSSYICANAEKVLQALNSVDVTTKERRTNGSVCQLQTQWREGDTLWDKIGIREKRSRTHHIDCRSSYPYLGEHSLIIHNLDKYILTNKSWNSLQ